MLLNRLSSNEFFLEDGVVSFYILPALISDLRNVFDLYYSVFAWQDMSGTLT